MPILPKFLKRKNSNRRGRHETTPVTTATPLSPVQEVIHVPASDTGSPRPVPPPQLHSHVDDFEPHDLHHSNLGDDLHDPHSRLYETFSSAPSQDGLATVPRVLREDDGPGLHHHHFDDHTDGIGSEHPGDLGFVQTERSGPGLGSEPPVFIAPSNHSDSSNSSSQKVTFIGDMRSHDRGTPHTHRKALSTSSRSMSRRVPVAPSTLREHYRGQRRHVSESSYPPPPRMSRPEYRYEFRRPYLIFTDFGEGLEVGNEEDGFMRYQDFRDTAHLRANRQDTYYIIPGSTPVIFNDDAGNELYRVDAWKYNTPTLRRKLYIIEDENGRELFRVGGTDSSRYSSDGYSSGSYSSNMPKVQYLNSELGSMHYRPASNMKYYNKNTRRVPAPPRAMTSHSRRPSYQAATPLTRSALFEDDEGTVSSHMTSNPDIVVVNEDGERIYDSRDTLVRTQPPHAQSQYVTEVSYPSRPDTVYVDEHGSPVDRARSPEYPWSSSGTESEESYQGSRRHSRVYQA